MNHCSAFFMLQYPFNIVMKQKIILFLKTTLTTSCTLLERVFTNLHRTTACLLFLQNLLDLHCYLPHFSSSFPPCWRLFSPCVVPADSVCYHRLKWPGGLHSSLFAAHKGASASGRGSYCWGLHTQEDNSQPVYQLSGLSFPFFFPEQVTVHEEFTVSRGFVLSKYRLD